MMVILFLLGLTSFLPKVQEVPGETPADALYLSKDQGETWGNFGNGLPADVQTRTVFEHEGTLFLLTHNQGVYRLAKSSDTWLKSSTGLPYLEPFFLPLSLASSGGVLVLGTMQDGVFLSRDAGRTWYAPENNINQVVANMLDTGESLLAGTHAGIWESKDHGENWARIGEDLTPINGLMVQNGMLHIARQNGMGVLEGDEISWSEMKTDWAIIQLLQDDDYVYARSAYLEIYRSRDGKHWESPCEEGIIRQPKNLAQRMWNGYRPDPPSERVPGMIVNTSRGWVLPVGNGGC
jgi:hypothetical protein